MSQCPFFVVCWVNTVFDILLIIFISHLHAFDHCPGKENVDLQLQLIQSSAKLCKGLHSHYGLPTVQGT